MTIHSPILPRRVSWARLRARAGATAIEYALVAPVLLLLILGIGDVGRLMFTQVALDRAVQAAARCAAVDPLTCGTSTQTQAYAASQSFGVSVNSSAFVVSAAPCGQQVTAALSYTFMTPGFSVVTLTAGACRPVYA